MKKRVFPKSSPHGKYSMLTAYDALTSGILEVSGVDIILVGDTLGMVLLGYPNTAQVTMEEMIHHAKAVRRGAPKSFILGDLPKKGVEKGSQQALASARQFLKAGMNGVKMEWRKDCLKSAELLVKNKIFVQGHVGLTPQDAKDKSDFRVRGKDAKSALEIFKQAKALEAAGVAMLLLECVPWELGRLITEAVKIPTIGIGAGSYCDGQVLVFHDLIGMFEDFTPKFVKHYAEAAPLFKKAVANYIRDVRESRFPAAAQSFKMDAAELEKLKQGLSS